MMYGQTIRVNDHGPRVEDWYTFEEVTPQPAVVHVYTGRGVIIRLRASTRRELTDLRDSTLVGYERPGTTPTPRPNQPQLQLEP